MSLARSCWRLLAQWWRLRTWTGSDPAYQHAQYESQVAELRVVLTRIGLRAVRAQRKGRDS